MIIFQGGGIASGAGKSGAAHAQDAARRLRIGSSPRSVSKEMFSSPVYLLVFQAVVPARLGDEKNRRTPA